MAPVDLMSLLTGGGNALEQQYQAADPWYQAGRGISQVQFGAPRDSTEAFLMPFLQNSLAGGLTGYGKSQANETAYGDISKMLGGLGYESPTSDPYAMAAKAGSIEELLGSDAISSPMQYGLAEAPEGFTIKGAMPDIALALSNKQAQQEAAAKKAEILDKLKIESSPEALEAARLIEQNKASGKKSGEGTSAAIPAAIMGEVADQAGIVEEARAISAGLRTSGKTWADIQKAGMFAGLDEDGVAASVADLADRVMRSRTGATAPAAEAATIKKFIAGDRTVGPQQMANLLEKFADREANNAKAKIKIASSPDPSALFDAPTSQKVKAPLTQAQALAIAKDRGLIK